MTQLDATDAVGGSSTPPTFYTAGEVARLFRLDESTLYRHLRTGKFPGLKVGGRYVVPRAVVERMIADVLDAGECVDLSSWSERWRGRPTRTNEQSPARGAVTDDR